MNPKFYAEYLPLLQAIVAGKTIQDNLCNCWIDNPTPDFTWDPCHYRIKPEPQHIWKFRTKKDGYLSAGQWNSEAECRAFCGEANTKVEIVEFVEVIK